MTGRYKCVTSAYLDMKSLVLLYLFLQVLVKNVLGLQAVLWGRVPFGLEVVEIKAGLLIKTSAPQTLVF